MTTKETEIVMKKTLSRTEAGETGMVHAGDIAKIADLTAELLACTYSRFSYLTVSIDNMVFFRPVKVGDTLVLKASINCVKNSSMEVGVRIEVEDRKTQKQDYVTTVLTTLVAVDGDLKPQKLPPLKLKTDEQKRRFNEALERMDHRMAKSIELKEKHLR